MWRSRPADPAQIRLLRVARERFNLHPLAIHANYLVNLASVDPETRARSIENFRSELHRAAAIGAEYVVIHPGSDRGQSVEEGIASFVLGLRDAAAGFNGHLTILLENTAGAGSQLGSRLEELQSMRELARELTGLSIGFCLDTCHLFAAGFRISTPAGLRDTIRSVEEILGLSSVYIIHANDSKMPYGSRVDRHAHIGAGHIGLEAFRRILSHPKLRGKPFILETPVDEPGDDRRNLDILKALAASAGTKVHRVYKDR